MEIDSPFYSIITVTFNDFEGLKQTYESIVNQTYKNFEWIVIDGGSIDKTVKFLNSNLHLSPIWISEKDSGIYDAMNKGIKLCKGKFAVFLNAGDIYPNKLTLEKLNSSLQLSKELPDVILGGATFLLPNSLKMYKSPKNINLYIWHGVPANHQAMYFKREALKCTLYDTRYKICGDYYIIARMFIKKMIFFYINEPLVEFKVGGASYKNIATLWKESYLIKKRVLHLPFHVRIHSLLKSIISTTGLIIVSQNYFVWLGKLVLKIKNNSNLH